MIFGFKQNPKKKILAFFKKGKSESAAEQLKVIWDELAVQDRLEILDSWPLKDSDKEMQQEWLSFVEKYAIGQGLLEDLENKIRKNVNNDFVFDYELWFKLAKEHKNDFFLVLATGNKTFPYGDYSSFLKNKIDPLLIFFLRRRLASELKIVKELLPFLKHLVKNDQDDMVKNLYVEYLFKNEIWEEKNMSLVQGYLVKNFNNVDFSDWVFQNLKAPLSGKWFDLLKKSFKNKPTLANKNLLAECCFEKGVYVDSLELEIANIGMQNKTTRLKAVDILLKSKKPKAQTIELLCLVSSERPSSEAILVFLIRHLQDEKLLDTLVANADFNKHLISEFLSRWKETNPVNLNLVVRVLQELLLLDLSLTKSEFKIFSSLTDQKVVFWLSSLAFLSGDFELVQDLISSMNQKMKSYFEYKMNLHFSNKKYDFLKNHFDSPWGLIDQAQYFESVSNFTKADDVYKQVSENKQYSGLFGRLKMAVKKTEVLTQSDFKKMKNISSLGLAELFFLNGLFYVEKSDWPQCEKFFKKAYEEEEDKRFLKSLIEVYYRWSSVLISEKKLAKAQAIIERGLSIGDDSRLLKNLILTNPKITSWNQIKKLQLKNIEDQLLSDYFWLAWRSGDYKNADNALRRCIPLSNSEIFTKRIARYYLEMPIPKNDDLKNKVWESLHVLNRPWLTAAIAVSQNEKPPFPKEIPSGIEKLLTGWSLMKIGQFENAQFHFSKLLNGPIKNLGTGIKRARSHIVLGYCFLNCKDLESAEEAWARSVHFGISNSLVSTLKFVIDLEKGVKKALAGRSPLKNYVKALNHPITKDAAEKNLAIHFTFSGDFLNAGKYWDSLVQNFSEKKSPEEEVWLDISIQMANYCHKVKDGKNINLIEMAALEDEVENIKKQLKSYRDLGVEPGVSEDDLESAYFQRIKNFTPERNPKEFRRIEEARQFIADPDLRLRTELFTQSGVKKDKLLQFLSFYECNPLDFFVDLVGDPDFCPELSFFKNYDLELPACKKAIIESAFNECRKNESFESESNFF